VGAVGIDLEPIRERIETRLLRFFSEVLAFPVE
jgi:hypothetical protein